MLSVIDLVCYEQMFPLMLLNAESRGKIGILSDHFYTNYQE